MESNKVVHVHLKDVREGDQSDFYFGSIRAIYDTLTEEQIGRSYNSLISSSIKRQGGIFENKKCVIRVAQMQRRKQIR